MYTVDELREIIDKGIKEINISKEPNELYAPIIYTLGSGGKRLRPILVLMACNIFNDRIDHAIAPAIGIELFHNFTLLHDDIMDNAFIRRGNPTVHKKWDTNTAILSGDAMLILAYQYIGECCKGKQSTVMNIFNNTAMQVCEGQQYDMNYEKYQNITVDEYLQMIEYKTSVLIAACLKIGAILGDAGDEEASILYEYGKNIGLAFQLQDDLLDLYSDESIFGKKTGGDIVCNKKTFLLVNALNMADAKLKAELEKELANKDFIPEEKVHNIKGIYDMLNLNELTEEKINFYYSTAREKLTYLSIDEARISELNAFTDNLLKRKN